MILDVIGTIVVLFVVVILLGKIENKLDSVLVRLDEKIHAKHAVGESK